MATPSATLAPDLIKRITYSKYLLRRATFLQREGNELATAEALLFAHDGAEMLMRVVTDFLGASPPKEFMNFWNNAAEKTKSAEPPHRGTMDRLNNLRIGFKHKGNLPNRTVVDGLLPIVTSFCLDIATLYLKIDYEKISLADLIPNDEARKELKKAEEAFEKGDAQTSFLAFGVAYDKLREEARSTFGPVMSQGHWDRWDSSFHWSGDVAKYAKALQIDKIAKDLQRLIDITDSLAMGIQPQQVRKFESLTPHRSYAASGEMTAIWSGKIPTLDREAFEFCHTFVIDFALRLLTV
jgi:hypothetical protein